MPGGLALQGLGEMFLHMDALSVLHEWLPYLANLFTVGTSIAHGLLMPWCVRVNNASFLELMAAISTGEFRVFHMHVLDMAV